MTRTLAIAATLLQLAATAAAQSSPADSTSKPDRMVRDTPRNTTEGNTFIAPAGWAVSAHGSATVLEPPEGGSAIALVDVRAPSADSAVALAWQAYKPDQAWPLKVVNGMADKDGWTDPMRQEGESALTRLRAQLAPRTRRAPGRQLAGLANAPFARVY
jgi:hypothetical protein